MRTPSDVFSFSRWALLVRKHWMENGKKYSLFLLACTGLLTAWYFFLLMVGNGFIDVNLQFATYFFGLYLTGCLYGSTIFAELSSRRDGINYLTLPASQLEKCFCAFLYGVVIFFIGYTLVYYLVDIPMVSLSNHLLERYPKYEPGTRFLLPASAVYNIITAAGGVLPEKDYHVFLLGFFSIQAVFILGPLYFRRYALIKSIMLVLAMLLVIVLVMQKGINLFLPRGWYNLNLSWGQFDAEGHPARYVMLSPALLKIVMALLQYGIPVLIWIITYHRLKEKEI